MKRYDALNAAHPGDPYVDANLDTGAEGSYPSALGFDAVMTEIENAIAALGGVPANPDWTQLGTQIVAYIADQIAAGTGGKVSKAGDIMTGALVLAADPVVALQAATKQYVDAKVTNSINVVAHNADYNFVAADRGNRHRSTAAAKTWTLLAAATAGAGWNIQIIDASGRTVLTSPAANLYVNGAAAGVASYIFTAGEFGILATDGVSYYLSTSRTASMAVRGASRNLKVVTADGGTAVTITADYLVLQDSTGNVVKIANFNATGGIDTGALASGAFYYVHPCYNPATGAQGVVVSLSASSPTLPAGSTFSAPVGEVHTKSGSAVFIGTLQNGNRVQNTSPPLPIIASGTSGSPTTPTWTSTSVSAYVPPTATAIIVNVAGFASAAVMVAPNGSYGAALSSTNPSPVYLGGNGNTTTIMALESTNIDYASSSASGAVAASGWITSLQN